MSLFWQQVTILIMLVAAFGYLFQHWIGHSKSKRPCDSCGLKQIDEKKQATDNHHQVNH